MNLPQDTIWLIAIMSCVKHALDGTNQAMRETWLQDVSKFNRLDYRFVLGNGKSTDDALLQKSWDNRSANFRGKPHVELDITTHTLRDDELALDSSDAYSHHAFKIKAFCRWALAQQDAGPGHYIEHIFFCVTDTFVVPERLMASGFGSYDYVGHPFDLPWPWAFACGGNGIWISRKAAEILAAAPVDDWIADSWMGKVLHGAGICLQPDRRYTSIGAGHFPPMRDNVAISSHISDSPKIYDSLQMRQLYHLQNLSLVDLLRLADPCL